MEDNRKQHGGYQERPSDQEDPKTTNEAIRDAHGDPDMDLNELKEGAGLDTTAYSDRDAGLLSDTGTTRGADYTPNDASAVRSGGTTDMDDQTGGSMGIQTGTKHGFDSGIAQKRNVTGSDYDGQNSTSNP
jgi:hypothetical protein